MRAGGAESHRALRAMQELVGLDLRVLTRWVLAGGTEEVGWRGLGAP